MKKILLSLAVSTALVGCGGGETLEDVKQETTPVLPIASVKFDPANSVISIPNDILMSGTKDGTLNLPGELDSDGNSALVAAQYADPSFALGALDGWSTQMPYVIDLAVPAGHMVNKDSVSVPGAVKVFEVVMGANQADQECKDVPAGIACKLVGELQFGVDFVSALTAGGDGIAIQPLKPFKQSATYITVLTTGIEMADGRPITASSSYTLLRQDLVEQPLVTDSQKALQAVINSYERVVTLGGDVDKENIIFTAAATMQSVAPVVGTIKNLLAGSVLTGMQPKVVVPEQPVVTVNQISDLFDARFAAVQYLRGSIQLPMYSSKPKGTEISDLAGTFWQAQCDSGVIVAGYKAAIGGVLPEPEAGSDDAFCASASGGALRDLGLTDGVKFLTKYNTIPKKQWDANVPVQITKPVAAALGLTQPEAGWPVVILQHGITSKKEDMLALTLALSAQGFATIAIDHPMHGERGIDVDEDGTDDFNATSGRGSVLSYMNLTSLLVARDNLRQSSVDLLGLRLGLNFVDPALGLNPTDVSFVGHSLGSVVAPNFIAHANLPLAPTVDPLFKIQAAGLSVGGGGIVTFLLESASFGPFVKGSVLSAAGNTSADAFNAFLASGVVAESCKTPDLVPCGYSLYVKQLTDDGNTQALGAISAIMQQFAVAAQTALDSGDPLNYAGLVQATQTPIYASVVIGGVDGHVADLVVPATTTNPLSGGLALAKFLGATQVSESVMGDMAGSYSVNFSQGNHSSLLSPSALDSSGVKLDGTEVGHLKATVEMQTQLVSFLLSKGKALAITDADVVAK